MLNPDAGYHQRVVKALEYARSRRKGWADAMRLALCVVLWFGLAGFGLAQESNDAANTSQESGATSPTEPAPAPVARLEVIPVGDQSFDLLTGETVLEQGGTIRDQVTGLSLEATLIRYVEGAYIEAINVSAVREEGTFEAPLLRIELADLIGVAEDGVRFVGPGLTVEAERAEIHFGPEVARFDQAVASEPQFTARAFLLSLQGGDALLLGPYEYQQGFATLRDPREEGILQLTTFDGEDGLRQYRASTQVDDTFVETFGPVW